MKYAGLKYNDTVDGEGICVSFWAQGCPHHCPNCHNPETWSFKGGMEVPSDIKGQLIKAISANGVQRNCSFLGGEPLCQENLELIKSLVEAVRIAYPSIKIFVWTGYTVEELLVKRRVSEPLDFILSHIDVLIDGRYIQEERDITLKWRGSRNQRILYQGKDF